MLAGAGAAPEAIRLAGRWAPGSFSIWRYAEPTIDQTAGLAQLMARPVRIAGDARPPAPTRDKESKPRSECPGGDGHSCGSA